MSQVKNIKIGNTSYGITDANTLPALTSAQRTTLLSDGTYLGKSVTNNTVFETYDGKFEMFTDDAEVGLTRTIGAELSSWDHLGMTYLNGYYIGYGSSGIYYSSDFTNWNTNVIMWRVSGAAYGDGKYAFIGWSPTNMIMGIGPSLDNITVTSGVASVTSSAIAYGNNIFVALSDGSTYYTCSDGENWVERTGPFSTYSCLAFGNGRFVRISNYDSDNAYTSTDGINWTAISYPGSTSNSLKYLNNQFVSVDANNYVYASTDGINWEMKGQIVVSGSTTYLTKDITYSNGVYFANYRAGTDYLYKLKISSDLITWNDQDTTGFYPCVLNEGPNCVVASEGTSSIRTLAKYVIEAQHTYALTDLSYNKMQIDNLLVDKADDPLVVHKADAEEITGAKTFTSTPRINLNNPNIWLIDADATKGTAPSSVNNAWFGTIFDKNGLLNKNKLAQIYTNYATNGAFDLNISCFEPTADSTSSTTLKLGYNSSKQAYTSVVAPTEDTTSSTQIDTVGARNTKLASYQDKLVSGTNIKTINNTSILGSGNISVSATIDDKSITENTSNELQTIGVINNRDSSTAIKTWTGTLAQYDAIETKDGDTLYNITDDNDYSISLLEMIYPIGSVYITSNSICPLSALFGTWEIIGSKLLIDVVGSSSAPVIGNGTTLGVTDGTNNAGLFQGSSTGVQTTTVAYDTSVGETMSTFTTLTSNKTMGITTDSEKSGIIADISSALTKTEITVNIFRRTE